MKGRAAIANYNMTTFGGGKPGLPPGVVNNLFVEVPLVNLSADGNSAKARWYGFHMLGGGADARWESGTFENEYVKDKRRLEDLAPALLPAVRRAATRRAGATSTNPLPLVPYHFKNEDEAGTPIPPASRPRAEDHGHARQPRAAHRRAQRRGQGAQPAERLRLLHRPQDVGRRHRPLHGRRRARDRRRRRLRRAQRASAARSSASGPAGLKHGQLNDHPQFDTIDRPSRPAAMEARARGLEFGMLGEADQGNGVLDGGHLRATAS